MKLDIILLTIITSIYIACGQNDYELEFLEESIFTPCENYPDNYIDKLFDVSNAHIEQTDDGSLVVNGYTLVKRTVDGALPLTVEAFKKERGTWQPTLFTQKRDDTCTACFSKSELWHNYLKNTPEEQLTCPFTEGQRYDFDINEPTYMSLPIGNADGEYKVHVMAGSENDDFFICTEIHAMIAYSQNSYELEFIEEGIFSPCENYPNKFLDQLFDTTNLIMGQTDEGSLILNGYVTIKSSVEQLLPMSIEVFKFERGNWQPTIYSLKRNDACTSFFSKTEIWSPYLENTPTEELKCPFTAGQRLDFDVNKPTYLSLPRRDVEGEYKLHAKAGSENAGIFFCVDVFAKLHKM